MATVMAGGEEGVLVLNENRNVEAEDDGGNHIDVNGATISVITLQPGSVSERHENIFATFANFSTQTSASDYRDATNFPQSEQTVRIHYVATLQDGSQFDSSRDRDQPVVFKLDSGQVLPGLEVSSFPLCTPSPLFCILSQRSLHTLRFLLKAGVRSMSRGQIAKIKIPPEAAYGSAGYLPIIPPNATLLYEVELVSFASVAGGTMPSSMIP